MEAKQSCRDTGPEAHERRTTVTAEPPERLELARQMRRALDVAFAAGIYIDAVESSYALGPYATSNVAPELFDARLVLDEVLAGQALLPQSTSELHKKVVAFERHAATKARRAGWVRRWQIALEFVLGSDALANNEASRVEQPTPPTSAEVMALGAVVSLAAAALWLAQLLAR